MLAAAAALAGQTLPSASPLTATQPAQPPGVSQAAMPPPAAMTPAYAVELALKYTPAIRVSVEQSQAAAAGIRLARAAYLPRVDVLAQADRATRNNVFGLLLPQSLIPSVTGPVLNPTLGSSFNTAVGTSVSWEPFDFGARRATVDAAEAARAQSQAAIARVKLEVTVAVADACLTLEAAEQTVRAAQAGVERADTIIRQIDALVKAELRPGADASRAQAELAAARSQWIQAQSAADIARVTLSQYTGIAPEQIAIAAPKLLAMPLERLAERAPRTGDAAGNPAMAEQSAAVLQAQAQLRAAEHAFAPRFQLQGTAFGRGAGSDASGTFLGGANGLGPNVGNYAVGMTVTISLGDWAADQARQAAGAATVRAQQAKAQQVTIELQAQWNKAAAALWGARRLAANTPYAVTAAHAAVAQMQARYQAGLGTIAELADAQRLLTQSEIDDALARLNVWRAMLAMAAVAGDIQPFLAELQ